VVALVLLPATAAQAHPLGNFTVNTYSGLRVAQDAVGLDLVVDMAEIPAYQERQSGVDSDHDGQVSAGEASAYRGVACGRLASQATLTVGGASVPLAVTSARLAFPPGQAGLSTLRLTCALRGATRIGGPVQVRYRITAYGDRVGWREVTAIGDGTTLTRSDVPTASRSARLTAYPADLLTSPLDVRGADLEVRPGGPAAGGIAAAGQPAPAALRGVDRATRAFTGLVSRQSLTVPFGLLAVLLALLLGGLHAFAPGHGKTVMAAFLVGRHHRQARDGPGDGRAGWRQAASIGLTVTATHTAGVLLLGLVLIASVSVAPQRLYPWLGLLSGLLLAGVGATLVRRPRLHHHHGHDHHGHGRHDHHHDDDQLAQHDHGPGHRGHADEPGRRHHDHRHLPPGASRGRLLAMGLVGGLVPSPSALVVLLGAVALGRTWFGVMLVIAYGAGMAGCLVGVGALLARGGRLLRRAEGNRAVRRLNRALPALTAAVIVVVGLGLAMQAAATLMAA
jgi:ABC-type nickel/cobalt efflux system permease component RcnA